MKTLSLTFLLTGALAFAAMAQSDTPSRFNKAIYVEALGNGLGVTANYDMRLKRGAQDGIGFRAGVGGLIVGTADYDGGTARSSITTFPLVINYLIGERRSAFEAGLGITPIYANMAVQKTGNPGITNEQGWASTGFINLGYRYQPINNGFVFRFDWTPAINSTGFSPAWFGLSLGYGFK